MIYDEKEIELRKKKYFPFKIGTWSFGIILLVLLVDFMFFKRAIIPNVKDPIKVYLILGMISSSLAVLDPLIGLIGGVIIARWSISLISESKNQLLGIN